MRKITSLLAFSLLTTLLVMSCRDDDAPINTHIITEDYYFQAILDGDTVTYQEGINQYTNIVGDFYGAQAANGLTYAPFTCIANNVAATNPNPTTLAKSGALAIIAPSATTASTLTQYAGLVTTGTLPVGRLPRDSSQTAVAGFFVSIFDASGVEWNTNNGPLGAGSVTVTEYNTLVDNTRIPATQRIFAATFTCTVYNAAGASKLVTGGKVRGRLVPWQ